MSDDPEMKNQAAPANVPATALEAPGFATHSVLYAGDDRDRGLFVEYLRTLARHRALIGVFAVAGVIASLLWTLDSLPVYRARTSLDIQSLNSDFMNLRKVAPTGGEGDSAQGDYVQTQIKLLESDTLLDRTVAYMNATPHPASIEQRDFLSRVEGALHLGARKQIAYGSLVDDAAKHVVIKPIGVTRLVEVTCDSWDPGFSAKFCNALVDQFRQGDLENRQNESQKTSDWLTSQVKDVKLKAEESQRKLEAATGGNGLVLSQESTGVEEDRLRQMQTEYVKAQADRMEKAAAAGIGSASSPGMDPNLNESAAYRQYEQKLAELQGEVAKLVPPLTEANPAVIHLRSQIKSTEANMVGERAANAGRLKSDYEAALHREAMLASAYHREESTVSSDLGKASRVSLLRREVESEQQLYQTLLQLAREAGFASAIHASTIRVVDAAKPAKVPFSPRRSSSAASGLLAGTLCGVGLAFFIDRTTTVFRVPGESERYLGLCELGVIPSSPRPRALAPIPVSHPGGAQLIPPRAVQTQAALSSWSEEFSIVAEAYRNATTSIMLSENPREKGRVYMLSSPNAGEGKTTVTSNLGVALSKSRLRVLLIDGDLRKPALHKVLQVPNDFGLRNLLRGETRAGTDSAEPVYRSTALPNLFVLPSGQGSEEVVELLHSPHAGVLIKRLRAEFDVIIIDTPPMLHLADTRILAPHAQGAILVVRAGSTTRDEAMKARDLFAHDRVRLLGTILNDFDPQKNGLTDYYKSYYRYVDGVSESVDETSSWLGGLLRRDPRMIQPKSDSGAFAEPRRVEPVEESLTPAADAPPASPPRPRVTPLSARKAEPATGKSLDEFVTQFVTKVFKLQPPAEPARKAITLGDSQAGGEPLAILDRRRTQRHEGPQLFAHYWDGGPPQAHGIRNISANGLYIIAKQRWYPGTQIMIMLQRPGATAADTDRSIKVKAKVVRYGNDGTGFEFVLPDPDKQRGKAPKMGAQKPDMGEDGAGPREIQRFLQRLPKMGSQVGSA